MTTQNKTQPRTVQHTRAERLVIYTLAVLLGAVLTLGLVTQLGLIIGNPTNSIPPGLYRVAAKERADHVTFCLGIRHRGEGYYARYCSPDVPDGIRIIKRIAKRHPDGSLTVAGDTHNALDSRYLGPIRHDEIQGWWVPLLTEKPAQITGREAKP